MQEQWTGIITITGYFWGGSIEVTLLRANRSFAMCVKQRNVQRLHRNLPTAQRSIGCECMFPVACICPAGCRAQVFGPHKQSVQLDSTHGLILLAANDAAG